MKILNIKFKNINNLKGENIVSFESEPLLSAGIFAITGPTGSGKSTLLDVITLALFNKIPRFKGAISKTSIEGHGSVVTHHMDEAFASITYEIHQKKYTSSWSVGKTRTGNFKDYEMFIYDASGTPLDLKKSEVPAKNEELIGLKYDQFVKSIILSQGQFSKFLKADKHERGQLLENLTGSSIYRKISIAAYEKYKTVKDEVALEKDRLENIQTLSDEDRDRLTNQIKSNEVVKKDLAGELDKLNHIKQIKTEIEKISITLNRKQAESSVLENEKIKFKDRLNLLDTHDKLSPVLGDLATYSEAKQKVQKLSSEITKNEQRATEGVESRKAVMAEMKNLAQKEITIENFSSVMSTFEREVNKLSQEISYIGKTGRETRQKINDKALKHSIALDPKAGPDVTIPILKNRIESCNQLLLKADLKLDANLDVLNANSKDLQNELNQLKELKHAYEHKYISKNRVDKTRVDLKKYIAEVDKYKPLVHASKELVISIKENIKLLQKQQQDALLIAKLSDHRSNLVEGEPCPLCGATDHPFAEHLPSSDTDLSITIQKTHDKLLQYEKDFNENNRLLTSNITSKDLLEKQITRYEAELKTAIEEEQIKIDSYKGAHSIEGGKLEVSIKTVEEKTERIIEATKALQNRNVLKDLVIDFDELKSVLTKYSIQTEQLKQKYTGSDVSKECNMLQDRFVRYSSEITSLNNLIHEKQKEHTETRAYIDTTIIKLDPEIKKIGFTSIDEATEFMISETELNQLKAKKDEFAKRSTSLETEIKTLREALEKNMKADGTPEINLQEISQSITLKSNNKEALIKAIGENTAIIFKDDAERARIKTKKSVLAKLQEKLNKWALLNKLIGEKTGNKFANFAQGLTLQNLLVFANKRLQKLSDRYLLDKPIKDGALTVIDQYQGNIQRSVATLSGGESFLISLALALSLSDMASKNVNLESLFIDEGFGTLDQESLDIAMDTLEKLQTESQKMVGVISHVEALKERIHVQIKLEKSAQGYGSLKIEG